MKKLLALASLAALSMGFSSCCSMFGMPSTSAGYRTETKQVKTCSYDIITEEVHTPGDAKSGKGGTVEIIEKKVPRYKTVTKKVRVPLPRLRPPLLPEKRLLRHHFRIGPQNGHRPRSRRQPEHRPDPHHEAPRRLIPAAV